MPYFICPRCAWRGSKTSRTAGFSSRPAGCDSCGFGFLFELQDDYYPAPRAGVVVCDQQGRILALGKGADVLLGYKDVDVIGQDLATALHLEVDRDQELPGDGSMEPHAFALEWGVRVLDMEMHLQNARGERVDVIGDFFAALDDDGGLLAVFTPRVDEED